MKESIAGICLGITLSCLSCMAAQLITAAQAYYLPRRPLAFLAGSFTTVLAWACLLYGAVMIAFYA